MGHLCPLKSGRGIFSTPPRFTSETKWDSEIGTTFSLHFTVLELYFAWDIPFHLIPRLGGGAGHRHQILCRSPFPSTAPTSTDGRQRVALLVRPDVEPLQQVAAQRLRHAEAERPNVGLVGVLCTGRWQTEKCPATHTQQMQTTAEHRSLSTF